nr:MAG TPA: hypothetical protein [Caudoviricetes sp.]
MTYRRDGTLKTAFIRVRFLMKRRRKQNGKQNL